MACTDIFIIDYKLHGQPKSFIIRAHAMGNVEAWHRASCDVASLQSQSPDDHRLISSLSRRKYGITDV
ncbi:DUF6555 family protein [Pseudomonas sp. Sample_10]|uniref:DUF6555 family protein n=1 Tax=Pseudomonas sp. Sample_10 TaxID=2448269 RepID=UPI001036CB7F